MMRVEAAVARKVTKLYCKNERVNPCGKEVQEKLNWKTPSQIKYIQTPRKDNP